MTATVIPRRSPRMGSLTSVTFQRYRYFSVASGTRDGPLPHHVTNTPAEPHLAHGESSLIVRAIQKDSVVPEYSSRGKTYVPYRRQFRVRERPPCRRESRYLRHQGRCLGDNRQACLSGHEGGSQGTHGGEARLGARPALGPHQIVRAVAARSKTVDRPGRCRFITFGVMWGGETCPNQTPPPPGPNGAIVPAGGLGTGAAGTGCARFPRLRRPPRLAAFFDAN